MAKINVQNIIGDLRNSITKEGIPFMEGRTPQEFTEGEVLTIEDYGFIDGEDGKYCVIAVKEDKEHFYFGGLVLTQLFGMLDENYTEEEIQAVMEEGIKITTKKKLSKNKRTYTSVTIL